MKKVLSILSAALLIISFFPVIPVSADVASPQFYEWTFSEPLSSEAGDLSISADSGNNTLLYYESDRYIVPDEDKYKYGYSIVDGCLYSLGGYFKLEKPIELAPDMPWAIEIMGRVPNHARLFAEQEGSSGKYIALEPQRPVMNGLPLQSEFNTVANGRLGQSYIQKILIWNEFNEILNKWELHFASETPNVRGYGQYVVTSPTGTASGSLGMTINYIGNQFAPFSLNDTLNSDGSLNYYETFIDYVRIWEDSSIGTAVGELTGDIFTEPRAGGARRNIPLINDLEYYKTDEKVKWVDESGKEIITFEMGKKYTASITLTPLKGFAFIEGKTKIPSYYNYKINQDGTIYLSRTFTVTRSVDEIFEDTYTDYSGQDTTGDDTLDELGETNETPDPDPSSEDNKTKTIVIIAISVVAAAVLVSVLLSFKPRKK